MCLHPIDFCSIVHNSQINGGEKKISVAYCFLLEASTFELENMEFDQLQEIVENPSIIVFVGSWDQVVQLNVRKTILATKSNS
jgi:hypothetical protein